MNCSRVTESGEVTAPRSTVSDTHNTSPIRQLPIQVSLADIAAASGGASAFGKASATIAMQATRKVPSWNPNAPRKFVISTAAARNKSERRRVTGWVQKAPRRKNVRRPRPKKKNVVALDWTKALGAEDGTKLRSAMSQPKALYRA